MHIDLNDLQTVVNGVKYGDDSCSLWEKCHRSCSDIHLQEAADQVSVWTVKHDMQPNYIEIYFGACTVPLILQPIVINHYEIDQVTVFKLLGLMIGNKLIGKNYVEYMYGKTSKTIYFLVLLERAGKTTIRHN